MLLSQRLDLDVQVLCNVSAKGRTIVHWNRDVVININNMANLTRIAFSNTVQRFLPFHGQQKAQKDCGPGWHAQHFKAVN